MYATPQRLSIVEVASDLGAAQSGATPNAALLKQAISEAQLIQAQHLDFQISHQSVQDENHQRLYANAYPHAKSIDAIYKVLQRTANTISTTLKSGAFPFVLAGDHSTAAGTIAGIKQAFPNHRLGVIWIDAHADFHSPYTTPSGNLHGMPLAIATASNNLSQQINQIDQDTSDLWEKCKALGHSDRPNLSPHDLVYLSVRDTEPAEDDLIKRYEIPVLSTALLRQIGPEAIAQYCLNYLAEADLVYVSFDVDSLDSSICMGTGTPSAGGLQLEEACRLNQALLKDPRICCWEMCEINPSLDQLNTMENNSQEIFRAVVDAFAETPKILPWPKPQPRRKAA